MRQQQCLRQVRGSDPSSEKRKRASLVVIAIRLVVAVIDLDDQLIRKDDKGEMKKRRVKEGKREDR